MKHFSIKIKITLWYLLLMLLMTAMVLGFIVAISNSVTSQTAISQISSAVHSNLEQLDMTDGKLQVGEDFRFYQNGIYTVVYSSSESLLAGQLPLDFSETGGFENGETRTVSSGGEDYYVLDLWRAFGWDNGVWVRGIMEVPESMTMIENILVMAGVAMPVFILLATLGGYWIAKKAFRPLEEMTATADSINEAADLSARMEIPPGNNEFTRLARTFDRMFERLEASFEAEKQFTADASHELRTPISVIKGACEYGMKYDETPEERQETITMIHRQAEKMSVLVSGLLSMTRLDQGTEKASFAMIDLSELIQSICSEQRTEGYFLHCDIEENISASVDVSLISRLFQNLLDNAVKYGRPQGNIWVSLGKSEGEILLSVRDDGMGISPEHQDKIWQRFYQADPSRSGDSGAGLGLSMVKKIAELHGGYMSLDSVEGKGSVFTLHLPKN